MEMRISLLGLFVKLWALLAQVQAFVVKSLLAGPRYILRRTPMQLSMENRKSVCVVGGGFGGLYTALKIGRKMDAATDVYLIEPKVRFVFLPLLYELAVGTASATEVAPRYKNLLSGTKVKFVRAAVEKIDLEGKTCKLRRAGTNKKEQSNSSTSAGRADAAVENAGEDVEDVPSELPFDYLVLAAGVQPRMDLIPGAKEHALPFYRLNDGFSLRAKLRELHAASQSNMVRVAVIGGGYSGVEVATNVAQDLGVERSIVTIVDRNMRLMQTSPDHNRNMAERALLKSGVNVYYNTSVKAVMADSLQLIEGASGAEFSLPADLVLFTAGTEQSEFIKGLEVTKNEYGKVVTSPTLQSVSHPCVYALGDCSNVEGQLVPATAQVAMQQSQVVGSNVLRAIKADRMAAKDSKRNPPALKNFKFVSLGEMLTLGDTDAAVTTLGGYVKLKGPLAAISRRAVYSVRQPTVTQTVKSVISASAVTTGKLLRRSFSSRRNPSSSSSSSSTSSR